MRAAVGALGFLISATAAQAAEYTAPRIQVLEGAITATYDCDAIPSHAEIAAYAAESLGAAQVKAGISKPVALLKAGGAVDAGALKVAFDLDVAFLTDNFNDGPRTYMVGLANKVWTGGDPLFPDAPEMQYWDVNAGCGYDLTDSIHKIINEHAAALVAEIKKSQRGSKP